ncbi:cupin domain-containing protein [Kitasatospora sp. LaBMicrA B282]|uniref:cupin domain-containing protein n=1 Tax=Kitasatospora sp. LaBMicrA B282 TaxID=3420949 RepID=UPI003D12C3FD
MEFRRLDRANLAHEYGVESQRILPWPALNAPFEGAYAVVRPGTSTTPHSHHEYEMFVATKGEAVLSSGGVRAPFRAGDVVHFRPGTEHEVINETDGDFEFFSVWWDAELAAKFSARHEAEAAAE